MARGWESKSVESQMEAAEEREASKHRPHLTAEEIRVQTEREGLLLTRKRVVADLERASNPRYRKQLESALAHLDGKLSALTYNTQTGA